MKKRPVSPGFFKDEELLSCPPVARILFIGLSFMADADGRLKDKPVQIKADVLPCENVDVNDLLNQLHCAGCIIRYQVDNLALIQVSKDSETFRQHAKPHRDEACNDFPKPPDGISRNLAKFPETQNETGGSSPSYSSSCSYSSSHSRCSEPQAASEPKQSASTDESTEAQTDRAPAQGAGNAPQDATAGNAETVVMSFPIVGGKTRGGPAKWPLTQSKLAEYAESYPGVNVLAEAKRALQWCRDNPTKQKTKRGMPAFLSRWFARVQDRGGRLAPDPAALPVARTEREALYRNNKEKSEHQRREAEAKSLTPEQQREMLRQAGLVKGVST